MQEKIHAVQKQAKKVLKSDWTKIVPTYTFSWGESLIWAEETFPQITSQVDEVRERVSEDLPMVVFQSRETPPEKTVVAVPYKTEDGNPYNIKLITSEPLTEKQTALLCYFAQAFLFLIASQGLPDFHDTKALSKALVRLTGKKLIAA